MSIKHLILLAALFAAVPSTYAQSTVAIGADGDARFREQLSPHGAWVNVGELGQVWRPASVEPGWRPYVNGQWLWTEAGWYWQSDEPWAWATYHYGRWVLTNDQGWVWVPGNDWAPSWVVWRQGGGYIGWAPLAPGGSQRSLTAFVFVNQTRFVERIQPSVIVVDAAVASKTVAISSSSGGSGSAVAGPKVEEIQKASGKTVPVAKAETLRIQQEANVPKPAAAAAATDSKPSAVAVPAEVKRPTRSRLQPQPAPSTTGEAKVEQQETREEESKSTPMTSDKPRSETPGSSIQGQDRSVDSHPSLPEAAPEVGKTLVSPAVAPKSIREESAAHGPKALEPKSDSEQPKEGRKPKTP